jgi:hypothetical protein
VRFFPDTLIISILPGIGSNHGQDTNPDRLGKFGPGVDDLGQVGERFGGFAGKEIAVTYAYRTLDRLGVSARMGAGLENRSGEFAARRSGYPTFSEPFRSL